MVFVLSMKIFSIHFLLIAVRPPKAIPTSNPNPRLCNKSPNIRPMLIPIAMLLFNVLFYPFFHTIFLCNIISLLTLLYSIFKYHQRKYNFTICL